MPELGRWNGMDQLSEAYSSFSPYAYVANNPVNSIDPDGRKIINNEVQLMDPDYRVLLSGGGGGGFASYFGGGGRGFSSEMNAYFGNTGSGWGTNGSAGGSASTFGGTAAYGAIMSGQTSSITNSNGYLNWNTLDSANPNGMLDNGLIGGMTAHSIKINETDWYGPAGKGNWYFGTAGVLSGFAGIVQSRHLYSQGIRRGVAGNYQLTGRNLNQFANMAMTKATTPISKIGNVAKIAGHFSFGLGVVTDIGGLMTGKVSFGKALLNTVFGAVGNWGGPIGASIGTVYFGVDNFYSGPGGDGWPGYFNDLNTDQRMLDEGFNQAGPYRFHIMGAHEPK